MVEEGKQVGEMDLWVELPGVHLRNASDFMDRYFRALWPAYVKTDIHAKQGLVESVYHQDQEAWEAVEKWGITTTTAPGVCYILIHEGEGVNVAYSDTTPEEHTRALEIAQNLRANRGLLWGP